METLISSNIAEALGWTILHSLWQGALVSAALMVLLKIMKNSTATQRYFVSLSSLCAIVVMAFATFISIYRPENQIVNSDLSELLLWDMPTLQASEKTWEDYLSQALSIANAYSPQISLLWIIGVTLLSIRFLVNLIYIHQLKTYKTKPASIEWEGRLKAIAQKINIHRQIKLVESALVEVPTVVGWLKPAILFPLGMFTALPSHEIESILAHELAHIRRNDFIINILQSVIEILFFYHPAVWYISKQIESERENCCDDIAVAVAGDSLTYIKALTHLATLRINHLSPALAITGKNGGLLQRVNRIARNAKLVNRWARQHTISPKLTAATIVIMSVLLLATKTEATQFLVEKLEKTPLDFLVKSFDSEAENRPSEQLNSELTMEENTFSDTTKKTSISKQITLKLDSAGNANIITLFGDTMKLKGLNKNTFFNINGDSLGQGILFLNPALSKLRIPLDKFEIDTIESKFGNICTYKIKGLDSLNTAWSWLHDGNNLLAIPSLKKMNQSQIDSLFKALKQKRTYYMITDSLNKTFYASPNNTVIINHADHTSPNNTITINYAGRTSMNITNNYTESSIKNGINLSNKITINTDGATVISSQKGEGEISLFVIDGEALLPKTKEENNARMRNLNPNNIANITILKGKNATETYGEEGKDGVVIITTKKGTDILSESAKINASKSTIYIQRKSTAKNPLVVVDSEMMEGEAGKKYLKEINAREIESVTVLREASATAIYGEKGRDGVIVVTTKKGTSRTEVKEKTIDADKTEVTIFPNPSRSEVNIRFATENTEPIWVEAYDIKGEKVATILNGEQLPKGQNSISWDTKALPTGAYLIRIKQGTTFSQYKVILD